MKLWQLKRISTGEALNEPQPLPQNWNGIFGMDGFKDRLSDLSWCNQIDMGWFEVEVANSVIITAKNKKIVDAQIEAYLKESSEFVAVDNVNITKGQRSDWMEYRRLLKEIPNQLHYPNEIQWPTKPS